MLGMTTHSENKWRVWKELSDILGEAYYGDGIESTNLFCILEDIESAMKKVEGKSERLRQLYEEVRAIIKDAPDAHLFSERAWVASYIFYLNRNKFKAMHEQINKNTSKIISSADYIEFLYNEEDLAENPEDVESIRKAISSVSSKMCNLESENNKIISEIKNFVIKFLTE
jgi:hypothetical protein